MFQAMELHSRRDHANFLEGSLLDITVFNMVSGSEGYIFD